MIAVGSLGAAGIIFANVPSNFGSLAGCISDLDAVVSISRRPVTADEA
jgi:hypothetical protein